MQGNLDLIRETLGSHARPVKDEFKLLDEQVERMRLIVTQLLQYARPTEYAGYVETLDLNQTIHDCLVLVAHLLAQTRIEVVRDLQATQRVGFNRQELQQVIINLLINAIQAMPQGGTLRLVTQDWTDEHGARGAMLQVKDTGPGLAPGVTERLFRPFFTTKNDGNGLGLWISLGLVERYGGSISAGNQEDGQRGAVFSVRLLTEPRVPDATPTRDGRPGCFSLDRPLGHSGHQIETLGLHTDESGGERRQRGVEPCLGVSGDGVAHGRHPGLHVGAEELLLLRQVGHLDVVSRDQVAHHFTHAGEVVFGLGHGLIARQPQRRQITTQGSQRLFVEEATEVERTEQVHLGLAHAAEQGVVLVSHLLIAQLAHGAHELAPRLLQKTTGGRRLGDGDTQLRQQIGTGRGVVEGREQAVHLGTGGFLIQGGGHGNLFVHIVLWFGSLITAAAALGPRCP